MHHKHRCCSPMLLSGILFTLIAILHIVRLATDWPISIDNTVIPLWPSVVVIVIAAIMAIWNFRTCSCPNCQYRKEDENKSIAK